MRCSAARTDNRIQFISVMQTTVLSNADLLRRSFRCSVSHWFVNRAPTDIQLWYLGLLWIDAKWTTVISDSLLKPITSMRANSNWTDPSTPGFVSSFNNQFINRTIRLSMFFRCKVFQKYIFIIIIISNNFCYEIYICYNNKFIYNSILCLRKL